MEIIDAKIVSSDRKLRISGGVHITILSKDNITKGENLELEYKDKIHYFEVKDISIDGSDLVITANEVGYWATKFDNDKNFDLRELIGLKVFHVKDPKTISKINEMSCWC